METKACEKGVISKSIAGFYYIDTGETVYRSKARGIFRKRGFTPLVGDRVSIEIQEDGDARIMEIEPRRNAFVRPPVANIEVLGLVVSARYPDPIPLVIDRFLVMAEEKRTEILLVINKTDLGSREDTERLTRLYESLYPVYPVSGRNGEGTEELKRAMNGKIVALAGPSGVGKSTLINRLSGKELCETGELSGRTGRGKQTTRASELFRLGNGTYLLDTPGFTSFSSLEASASRPLSDKDAEEIDAMEAGLTERELQFLFPEMAPFAGTCRFDNCLHLTEPKCRVKEALAEGKIAGSRYDSYCTILAELKNRRAY